jgi:hypothetical protein
MERPSPAARMRQPRCRFSTFKCRQFGNATATYRVGTEGLQLLTSRPAFVDATLRGRAFLGFERRCASLRRRSSARRNTRSKRSSTPGSTVTTRLRFDRPFHQRSQAEYLTSLDRLATGGISIEFDITAETVGPGVPAVGLRFAGIVTLCCPLSRLAALQGSSLIVSLPRFVRRVERSQYTTRREGNAGLFLATKNPAARWCSGRSRSGRYRCWLALSLTG